jgi:four helix bundle protein
MAKFEALEVALEMVRELAKLLPAIERHDKSLAKASLRFGTSFGPAAASRLRFGPRSQLREAATCSPACFAEGAHRVGRDRLHLYRVAGSSGAEVVVHLRSAVILEYVTLAQATPTMRLGDRVAAMGWRLTTPRRR